MQPETAALLWDALDASRSVLGFDERIYDTAIEDVPGLIEVLSSLLAEADT